MNEKELISYFRKVRKDFPILKQKVQGHDLVYVDNGASTQKPQVMIDSIVDLYSNYYSNVHRGVHSLSEQSTEKYEEVRGKVAILIGSSEDEVVFTKGATNSLNMIVFGLQHLIEKGDEIIVSEMEHHANLVPWQELCKRTGAKLKFVSVTKDYVLDMEEFEKLISKKTKVVSVPHVSNVLGTINPVKEMAKMVDDVGGIFVVDGSQSAPHMKIDVKDLDCDLFCFSAHKMCGPTGVGILYGKKNVLDRMNPVEFGGDMIYEVEFEKSSYNKVPYKFEAGTPNIEGVIAFGVAIDYLNKLGMGNIESYEKVLTKYFLEKVSEVGDLVLYGPLSADSRGAVFSFSVGDIHPHDMSAILDMFGVAIRGGHHCAMPLTNKVLGKCATSRVSLYFYNTLEEIDYIIDVLKKAKDIYQKGDFLL